MKYRYAFPLFFVAFLLQSTVVNHLGVLGVTPNLILCLVILTSFLYETNQGASLGVGFGLLQDLCFGLVIGPSAIAYFLVALMIKQLRRVFYRDNLLSVFFAAIIGTALYVLLGWGLTSVFGGIYEFLYVMKMMPVLMGYHFIIMIVFYLIRGNRGIPHPNDRYYIG